jgi:DNA-directed RNA polymerase specialized sigma24 family protein
VEHDTDIGGGQSRFPATRHSAVVAAGSADPEERSQAFGALVESYWKPVYKYVRIQWKANNEEAKDLTQGFFLQAMEKGWFARYDAQKARFRTYLRTCLDGYVSNERKAANRKKRAGDQPLLSLDFELAEGELRRHPAAETLDIEAYFHREWVRSLFGLAVEALRRSCAEAGKPLPFTLFERYDLQVADGAEKPTYQALADELEIPLTQVTNHLAWARREFRRLVLERLREVTGNEEEFRSEARQLLGVDPA